MADAVETQQVPTKDDLVASMRELAPTFRERAEAAEEARTLPDESVAELLESGIARALVPRRFGGYEMGLDAWFELVREASKGDASHGWCAALLPHCCHMISFFPEEAQKAVWSNGANVPIAGSVHPVAEVKQETGGYRVTGKSPFASGVRYSEWAFIGGLLKGAEGPPQWLFFLIPPGEYEVADTWFTTGMRGSGSCTIVTENTFVPETHVVPVSGLISGDAPGSAVNAGHIYSLPLMSYAPVGFAAVMLGAGQGALEYFQSWLIDQAAHPRPTMVDQSGIHVRMAKAAADLDAAELLLVRAIETAQGPERPTLELRARTMRDCARASEMIMAAIDTLVTLSGTAGFEVSSPVQRAWRDIHFAATHISLKADLNSAHWARTVLGIERPPTTVLF